MPSLTGLTLEICENVSYDRKRLGPFILKKILLTIELILSNSEVN